MFGASALYHRFDWAPAARRRLRRLDHVGIYGLIAGTYTPFGLLVLSGAWRITVLGIVWAGALCAIMLKVFWGDSPRWLAAAIAVALGWVGVAVRRRRVLRAADVTALDGRAEQPKPLHRLRQLRLSHRLRVLPGADDGLDLPFRMPLLQLLVEVRGLVLLVLDDRVRGAPPELKRHA